ncbi:hypothetical protein R5R35_008687 [Gryllus longicercus]|uniref:Uncharacterized protein n=1 Tax=Gryllus longicercus TaxID=2509291 RepID=A0AAN9VHJ9_9ORTH
MIVIYQALSDTVVTLAAQPRKTGNARHTATVKTGLEAQLYKNCILTSVNRQAFENRNFCNESEKCLFLRFLTGKLGCRYYLRTGYIPVYIVLVTRQNMSEITNILP